MLKFNVSILWIFVLLYFYQDISAESNYGKISGMITDIETGSPIPDASLKLDNSSMGTFSQSDGFYFLENIPVKSYTILVDVLGYRNKIVEKVEIEKNSILNIKLIPQSFTLDPIVVTATKSGHLLSKVTISSEILDEQRLQELGGETVGEVLNFIKGSYLLDNGGFAGLQSLSLRGSGTDQVLILLNGQRLNTGQGGAVDLSNIPLVGIDRIEMLKGGHSALYGSDAIGGMINIITHELVPLKGYQYGYRTTYGSFGLQKHNIQGSQKIGKFDFLLNYNHLLNEGDFEYKDPYSDKIFSRENNSFRNDNLFFNSKFSINSDHNIQFFNQTFETERGVAGLIDFPSLGARRTEKRQLYSLSADNRLSERFHIKERIAYQLYKNHYQDPAGWAPVDDLHKSNLGGASIQTMLLPFKGILLTSGIEYNLEKLKSSKFNNVKRDWFSIFLQSEFESLLKLKPHTVEWRIVPAIRLDKYSDTKTHLSPKIGLLMRTMSSINFGIRSNFGSSFRMPSFNDLYWPADDWSKGNKNLNSETSRNFDLGFFIQKNAYNSFQIEFNYFNNSISDFINWSPSNERNIYGFQIWQPQNIGKVNISGIESGSNFWLLNKLFNCRVSHTFMHALDETGETGKNFLIYRPKNKVDFSAGLNMKAFYCNFNYGYVGKRFTQSDNSISLPPYAFVNGSIGFLFEYSVVKLNSKFQVLNLLDKSVYAIQGYPLPGRQFRISVGVEY